MDTDSFVAYIKTEDIYVGIGKVVKARFDTKFWIRMTIT